MKMRVLETDQWTSTGDVEGSPASAFCLEAVTGGDSAAARALGIARGEWLSVEPGAMPPVGSVWFFVDQAQRLRKWRASYDSSG